MQIKANFVSSKTFTSNNRSLNLCTCINEDFGSFNFFVPTLIKLDYLKPVTIDFDVICINNKLLLKFVGLK